mmetsp:Transcript_23290/g.38956  ORF Transcript_23290/g.38956 Transcript_23290/m.38956 type:complete len:412 (-) Transcript_23290:77-1312(-)|eukprot:CAMPEP_0198200552 /NCGR_PEP_ID=MMETSP1445-20131203/3554_1 /TAXON_ID=36898 /ORGANISM="Pyramimonas sp., Strain CCMP2087" /LENGTH=411 /DNA_ID=CAMNT_0043870665 /DNA_START=169 /DNA_END=1404 /DNA_ORIENTATION=-
MSFRELRNFTEIMRSLGYPRLISMENFRQPNFELVADTLLWLAQRYDPSIDVVDDISTEADRVIFLKSISQLMAARGRIKLNMKRLYAADGYAVKELLKIASVLYKATSKASEKEDIGSAEFALSTKAFDVKQTRQLASEITNRGAQLYDALESEHELRELRQKAITRNMDMDEIESCVHEAVAEVTEGIRETEKQLENLEKDEKNLDAKIEKRKAALEISEKRLNSLESVRPPYMDEYEKLQADLQHLYLVYLERFRNLQFLESELENFDRVEQERMEESDRHLKKMQKRLREEEMRILRGETAADDSNIDFEMSDEEVEVKPKRKGKAKKGKKKKAGRGGNNVVGSLVGGSDSDSEEDLTEDDGSEGSESTHVSLNDDESVDDLINEDDDDELTDLDEDEDEGSSDNEF